ncbi:MAG TPA: DinB family protein [Terriglobales bacterium]
MLNHWYHHRGQLAVYLRLLEIPVPSVYGPSKDENPFA